MKLITATAVILTLFSFINCDEKNLQKQENLRKFQIDFEYSEKVLNLVKIAEEKAKALYEDVQNEYEALIVGINNVKNHLELMLAELNRIEEAHTVAFQNKDKAHTASSLADEMFKKAKEKLNAVETSGDEEKIAEATSEYTTHSREQMLSVQMLEKAEKALDNVAAKLDDIKIAVKMAEQEYKNALSKKESLQNTLSQYKSYLEEKINERINTEAAYNKSKAAIEKINPEFKLSRAENGNNGAGSFGMKQIVGFFCSLLTGAVAAGLIM